MTSNTLPAKKALRTLAAHLEGQQAIKHPIPEDELELAKNAFVAAKLQTDSKGKHTARPDKRKRLVFPSNLGIAQKTLDYSNVQRGIVRYLKKMGIAGRVDKRNLKKLSASICEDLKTFLFKSWPQPATSPLGIRGLDHEAISSLFDHAALSSIIISTPSRYNVPQHVFAPIADDITQLIRKAMRQAASTPVTATRPSTRALKERQMRRTVRTKSESKTTK
jgi:hypothetical protein